MTIVIFLLILILMVLAVIIWMLDGIERKLIRIEFKREQK